MVPGVGLGIIPAPFDGVSKFSMYGASFVQLAMISRTHAFNYVLDKGNQFKAQVEEGHEFLVNEKAKYPLNLGTLRFDSDHSSLALQAADVIA